MLQQVRSRWENYSLFKKQVITFGVIVGILVPIIYLLFHFFLFTTVYSSRLGEQLYGNSSPVISIDGLFYDDYGYHSPRLIEDVSETTFFYQFLRPPLDSFRSTGIVSIKGMAVGFFSILFSVAEGNLLGLLVGALVLLLSVFLHFAFYSLLCFLFLKIYYGYTGKTTEEITRKFGLGLFLFIAIFIFILLLSTVSAFYEAKKYAEGYGEFHVANSYDDCGSYSSGEVSSEWREACYSFFSESSNDCLSITSSALRDDCIIYSALSFSECDMIEDSQTRAACSLRVYTSGLDINAISCALLPSGLSYKVPGGTSIRVDSSCFLIADAIKREEINVCQSFSNFDDSSLPFAQRDPNPFFTDEFSNVEFFGDFPIRNICYTAFATAFFDHSYCEGIPSCYASYILATEDVAACSLLAQYEIEFIDFSDLSDLCEDFDSSSDFE